MTQEEAEKLLSLGLRFRPVTLEVKADPRIEAGDGAVIYDGKKKYKTFLTNCTFSIDGDTQIKNEAESAMRNSAEHFSKGTQAYRNLRKQLKKNKTEFEKALGDLAKQMQDSKGLFPITVEQEDGSSILYFCDTPKLEDAKVVIKLSSAGWAMSTDGGETWNVGALVDGEMIAKLLAVQGVNADWINTGALRVLDADGKETLYINADTGEVRVTPTLFSLSGKSVGDMRSIERSVCWRDRIQPRIPNGPDCRYRPPGSGGSLRKRAAARKVLYPVYGRLLDALTDTRTGRKDIHRNR